MRNYGAVNMNGYRFYVTGRTVMPNGKIIEWDSWKREAVMLETVTEPSGIKITYLTCEDRGEPDKKKLDDEIGEMMDDPAFWAE